MTARNRETLRNYFGEGKLPGKQHFGDLVDSMLNMKDEGFSKSPQNGLEISTPVKHNALMSFYRDQSPRSVLWSVGYGGERDMLHLRSSQAGGEHEQPPLLALDTQARVGINTARPRHALEVNGVIASTGRRGSYEGVPASSVLADGEWHDLTPPLTGCQAFEVMAGAGSPGNGRYALLHATAMNTYNPTAGWLDFFSRKKRIHAQHAWYGKRCDKLLLRWEGSSGKDAAYKLRIRSGCSYGNQVRIKVFLTQLWFDETTQEQEA